MDRKIFPSKGNASKPKGMNIWQEVSSQDDGYEEGEVSYMEDAALYDIGVDVYDQQRLEQGVMAQIDQEFRKRQQVLEQKRASREIKQVEAEIREVKSSIAQACRVTDVVSSQQDDKETKKRLEVINRQKVNKEKQLKTLQAKLKRLQKAAGLHVDDDLSGGEPDELDVEKASSSAIEWALGGSRDDLIKSGQMTPFGSMTEDETDHPPVKEKPLKKKLLLDDDGFDSFLTSQAKPKKVQNKNKSLKNNKNKRNNTKDFKIPKKKTSMLKAWLKDPKSGDEAGTDNLTETDQTSPNLATENDAASDGSDKEYVPDAEQEQMDAVEEEEEEMMSKKSAGWKKAKQPRYDLESGLPLFDNAGDDDVPVAGKKVKLARGTERIMDDGKIKNYQQRIQKYRERLNEEFSHAAELPEDKDLGGGLKVPGRVWMKLYKYQRTGVRWLWELHTQNVGGILGDEMGLGKTIQIISFLAALQQSKVRSRGVPGHGYDGLGPVLIITPTTVMHQWVREFHTWWPPLRVAILHDSGTYEGSRAQLVDNIVSSDGVLITSYERARINVEMLLEHGWHYVILDEGHKIRNPEAAVTTALKLFRTPHRIILSGSPVQNNLRELWSLFDFIFPGKLGTLPVFMEQFSVPIVQGGYSNATEIQVHTAYKCACKLRDTISPYLLRRMKRDVQTSLDLPAKNEQVLFCRLSEHQVEVYKQYLDSDSVHAILCREMKVFAGLIQLRKICNHPDLYTGGPKLMVGEPVPSADNEKSFGYYKRSGKMLVIASLLRIWKKQGHKVLLFSQSKAMVDILESFVKSRGYTYSILHGGTPVQSRQGLIKRFNEDQSIFVFLLTTRVGGLGVNLTGANRVVIYDPDWNPSTDSQAQERAWRIGQRRDVTIYRLLTSGTIEEKIYHRQIFKQFLTNRILKDPWQRRFFKSNDLHELFILKDHTDSEGRKRENDPKEKCTTETAAIFAGIGSEVHPDSRLRKAMMRQGNEGSIQKNQRSKRRSQHGENDTSTDAAEIKQNGELVPSPISTSEEAPKPDVQTQNLGDRNNNSTSKGPLESQEGLKKEINNDQTDETVDASDDQSSDQCVIVNDARPVGHIPNAPLSGMSGDMVSQANEPSPHSVCKSSSAVLKESLMRARLKFQERKRAEDAQKGRRKKKRHKKQPVVDGEVVSNVTGIEAFKGAKESTEGMEKISRKATDDYVLERLFKRAGVHSAMQHNTIMDSAHPDFALVEVEAERVAKESVRNLRLSRREYKFPGGRQSPKVKLRFGKKTKPTGVEKDDCAVLRVNKSKDHLFKASHLRKALDNDDSKEDATKASSPGEDDAPLSASQLLSSMRRRNHEEIHKQEELDLAQVEEENDLFGYNISQAAGGPSDYVPNPTEHDELMTELRNFIAFQCQVDGQAKTSEIMEEFGSKVRPEHAAIFKSILRELCTSQHLPGLQENVWRLKPEFR